MKKQSDDWDDIKVNRRRTDRVLFESTLIQQVSDGIDFLRNQSKEILSEIDKTGINDIDLEEFSKSTLNQIDDIVDDMVEFKSEIVDDDEIPDFVKDASKNAKVVLNRDQDYIRKAKRRFARLENGDDVDCDKTNLRIISLCDKAIEVNAKNPEAYNLKAKALINIGQYDDAIDALIKSLALEDDLDVWLMIGEANRLNLDFEDAISVYDKVLSLDENSFEAFKGKAMTCYDMGEYKKADEFFTKAKSLGDLDFVSSKIHEECMDNLE